MAMKFSHLCDSSTPLWSEHTSTNMEGNFEQMEFLLLERVTFRTLQMKVL